MTTKVKLDIRQGLLEVEGEEIFVRELVDRFAVLVASSVDEAEQVAVPKTGRGVVVLPPRQKGTKQIRSEPTRVADLNLKGNATIPSLHTFLKQKMPGSAGEYTAVFVYYLREHSKAAQIGVDHVYTCYRELNVKAPTAFVQSIRDAARRGNLLNFSNPNDIRLTVAGENLVEVDLPRSPSG